MKGKSKVLRIYIGSYDKINHKPLYEVIVMEAKKYGMAGATVYRGVLSYGANSVIHSVKIWELSADLPVIIEIIDDKEKVKKFIKQIEKYFEDEKFGGLIMTFDVDVIVYNPHKNGKEAR